MNIVHVSSLASVTGGAELALLELIDYELKHGINPHVILPEHGEMEKELCKRSVPFAVISYQPWRHNPSQNPLQAKRRYAIKRVLNQLSENKLLSYLIDNDIGLVHINTSAINLGSYAGPKAGIPLIWHIREFNNDKLEKTFYSDKHAAHCFNKATKVIAVSNTLRESIEETYVDKEKLVTIYDSVKAPTKIRQTQIFSQDIVKICLLANIVPQKGQMDAIEALRVLPEKLLKQIKLQIVGSSFGNLYIEQLKNSSEQYGLSNHIEFHDFASNPYDYFLNSDIALNCSRSESFGRTTVEAMLAGCLVIGNDNTCTHELLSNENGLLYTGPQDLADKIEWACMHADEARTIAQKGNTFAKTSFKDGRENIVKLFYELASK